MQQAGLSSLESSGSSIYVLAWGPQVSCVLPLSLVSSFTKLGKRYFCFGNCKVLLLLLLLFRSTNAGAREPAIGLSQRHDENGSNEL